MKFSIFKKVALWLLLIIAAVEIIMLVALYDYTYKKAVDDATDKIKTAADYAVVHASFFDPESFEVESEDETIIDYTFSSACDQFDIDIIYLLLPDTKNNTVMYLTRGVSAKQGAKTDSHPVNDLTGNYVDGGMTEEMKKAYAGDDSGIVAHISNENEDKLVCYMPVRQYYTENDDKDATRITALVSAEISLKKVTEENNARFRQFAIIMIIVTVTVGVSAAVILYFRVSKPLKKISKKMKSFVSEQDAEYEKLPVNGSDELAEMSDSFNTMAEELDKYIDDVAELNRQNAELNIAQTIQMGLLEPESFKNDAVTIKASMTTSKVVGGDLYDYRILENGKVFIAIGDVSGKGITAALFMSRAITLLNQYAMLGYSPAKMLYEYNNSLAAHNPNMMFITTFAAVYDPKTGELTYSNAGHNYPYILSDKLIKLDAENGLMAGAFEDTRFPEHTFKLKAGDILFLFTDGVTEAQNTDGELFGEERLEKILQNNKSGAESLLNAVTEKIDAFAQGAEQADDITMLALQIERDDTNSRQSE